MSPFHFRPSFAAVIVAATTAYAPIAFSAEESSTVEAAAPAALDFTMKTLAGEEVNLAEKYAGKVVLLVNVASKCGYTKQYTPLQELNEKYAEQGLAIVGVPCNQFLFQEPGSAEQIAEFCSTKYGVTFDLLEKVKVNGSSACELYKFLTSKETNPEFAGKIKWNFEKFLISREGKVVGRWASNVDPMSPEIVGAVEAELAK